MKHALRSMLFAAATLFGLAAFAQPIPPYPILITGMVQGCMPNSQVTIASMPGTQPSWSYTLDLVNCGFDTVAWMQSPGGAFTFNVACNGAMLTAVGQYQVDPSGSDSIMVVLNCGGGGTPDCLGVPGGSALPGTACTTALGLAGVWGTNCTCELNAVVDCEGVPNGPAMPGMPCTNPATGVSGFWSPDCICVADTTGGAYDCLGVLNGDNLPGTPCDDNDGWTILDTWTADCVCLGLDSMMYDCLGIAGGPNTFGTPCIQPATGLSGYWNNNCICVADTAATECSANFWVMQAYTYGDSVLNPGGGAEPIPNEVWVWNLSSGGTPPYTYQWSFGDGTSSVDPYPTHVYANGGPYQLCLTIADTEGCTSTYCDDVSVDDNGIYTGLIVDGRPGILRSGFTIRVISELPMAVAERNLVDEVTLWPNPVEDIIGLSFNSSRNANLILSIVDLNGRVIRTSNNAVIAGLNRHSISVAELEAGMYLLQISDGMQSTSRRFVKN